MTGMPATDRPPVIVLGFPRSGTTLLRRIFDTHPEVSSPPETTLLAACGRFMEESASDGPPLGALSGLAMAGIPEADVLAALRAMVFGFHARLAGGKPVWMEKSGFDIFHLHHIERLMAGHCRFLAIIRNPLDVIVSVRDLVDAAGHFMPEFRPWLQRFDSPLRAYAEAWIDRDDALRDFATRHPDTCLAFRYEDLVDDTEAVLRRLTDFIGVAPHPLHDVQAGLAEPGRIGLGDWKTFERTGIDKASIGRWRQGLSRVAAARLVPLLAPALARHGYEIPRVPREPAREDAMRQYGIAKRMRLSQGKAQ